MKTAMFLFGAAMLVASSVIQAAIGTWIVRDDFLEQPVARHTATLLPDGKVLVAGGISYPGFAPTTGAQLYDSTQFPAWISTGSLITPRQSHTATLLPNGRVLVVGGHHAEASAEIYDPRSGQWRAIAGPPDGQRAFHTATLLANGKVLITGGITQGGNLSSTALFDPATETWTATQRMGTDRSAHTATLLPDGRVLVVGGNADFFSVLLITSSSSEIYDPATDRWISAFSMVKARSGHSATLLPNRKVLVAGGYSRDMAGTATTLQSAEWFDLDSSKWSTLPDAMALERSEHTATLLPNGNLLVAGGFIYDAFTGQSNALDRAELFDPSSGLWTETNPMDYPQVHHTATLLPDGRVLVAGGQDLFFGIGEYAEIYDWAEATWTAAPDLTDPSRQHHTTTMLADGSVLVAGGEVDTQILSTAERRNPASGSWSPTGSLHVSRHRHSATLLPNKRVLAVGGEGADAAALATVEEYDPDSGQWHMTSPLSTPCFQHTASLLPGGLVLVAGGANRTEGSLSSAVLYHPAARSWRDAAPMHIARRRHTATLLPNGKVIVVGGINGVDELASTELYDPASNTWTLLADMGTPRYLHTASLLPDGTLLVTGGRGAGVTLGNWEIYDPIGDEWREGQLLTARRLHTAMVLPQGSVLLAGGRDNDGVILTSCEVYDPFLRRLTPAPDLAAARFIHQATLLLDGTVLVTGGVLASGPGCEAYDVGLTAATTGRPSLDEFAAPIRQGEKLMVTGSGFRGLPGGSSGTVHDSSTDYPLLQVRNLESGFSKWLYPDITGGWTSGTFASEPTSDLFIGHWMITVLVNSIPSRSVILHIVDETPPQLQLTGPNLLAAPLGEPFTDPGATASDDQAGTLTDQILVSGYVDPSRSAMYVRSYAVMDPSGNISETNRTIWVTAIAGSGGVAQLGGTVHPAGFPTTAWIEFGLTVDFPWQTTPEEVGSGHELMALTATLTNLAPNSTYYYRVASSNILGNAYGPLQQLRTGSFSAPGDGDNDGVIDQDELDRVLSLYWKTSPWLFMTNLAGLGDSRVTFTLPDQTTGALGVEGSTNLVDWQYLGPARPRYEFVDPEAPINPARYYRLRGP